ncbi:MAG: MBL fold metallo-hydrolase [Burkholderiales bacterium]|jgi:glyoxylase-like metal-dependent hydrolase (beta-lactamase superfamily II)
MAKESEGKNFQVGEFGISIIVHGFPGKSVCHGPLGFSTIALIRHGERTGLVDVGGFGQRLLLLDRLGELGLTPADVTDVLLTHSHYDHAINWVTFNNANVVIGSDELEWALAQRRGETYVPELYMEELKRSPRLQLVSNGDKVFPGVTAHITPGHTPGSLIFVLQAGERDVVFTGDACKNRAELMSRSADMTYDAQVTRKSIQGIWDFWSRRPGSILVPGHDLPMVQEGGNVRYLGQREAAIRAWYSEDLNKTTVISLTESKV